jgi:glycine/serine hydroxymethyltransferase
LPTVHKSPNTSLRLTLFGYNHDRLDESTGLIDYDQCELLAKAYRPKLLIAGASAYSRLYDYKRMREIADQR